MVLAYAVILFIVLALLLRRDISAIGQLPVRGGWWLSMLVLGLFMVQAMLVLYVPGQSFFQAALLILSQVALIFLFLLNRHLPGAKLFALGVFLNVLVMAANGGWMPLTPAMHHFVYPNRVVTAGQRPINSKNIILFSQDTNLWLLADIVPITLPWRRTAVSAGDILLAAAAAQFIFQASGKERQQTVSNESPL
jgi:hypothetical protein